MQEGLQARCDHQPFHRIIGLKWYEQGANSMSKDRSPNKEGKKQPTMTPKERKAAKRAKKEAMKSQLR